MEASRDTEILIGKLLKECIKGNYNDRATYLDGLVTSLDIYLQGKRTQKVDLIRNAIMQYVNLMLESKAKNDEHRIRLIREFYERFVVNADVWFSDGFSDDTILVGWIAQLARAKKIMRAAHNADEDRLKSVDNGFSDAVKKYGDVLDICQKCCEYYGLFEFNVDDRIADFTENEQ